MTVFRVLAAALLAGLAVPAVGLAKDAANNHAPEIVTQDWSFDPPFGSYDRAQLQRGFHIYKQICSNCHSLRLLTYRNLGDPGGPQFSPKAVETLASQVQITDGPNDKGEMYERPGRPSDHFRSPYPNEQAARVANMGALPPDLSVIAKAREGGPDYIYSLLTGYEKPPAGFHMTQGMQYNKAFPGHQVAMPPPLFDGAVPYTDGTKPTVKNYAKDVSAFLMWAAEPKLEERYKLGARVMVFLIVFAVIMYLSKRAVWARLHRRDHTHAT